MVEHSTSRSNQPPNEVTILLLKSVIFVSFSSSVIKRCKIMHDLATLSDLSDGLAIKANALGGVDEVRRGEEPGAQPAAPQYGL